MLLVSEEKLESLRTDNPLGRCVWHCDNDVVDHQSVVIDFADGKIREVTENKEKKSAEEIEW